MSRCEGCQPFRRFFLGRYAIAIGGLVAVLARPKSGDNPGQSQKCREKKRRKCLKKLAHPTGFEPVASAFGGNMSVFPKNTIECAAVR